MKIVLQEKHTGKEHPIQLPCVLGRSPRADLSLPDPTISHRHALISFEAGQVWIEDLQSANGVFINGERIIEKTPLMPEDDLLLGQTALLHVREEEEDTFGQTVVLHSMEHREEPKLDHQRLKLIYELTTQLSENQDFTAFRKQLATKIREIFRHDRGCLALLQEDGSLQSIYSESSLESVPLSQSILNRVFLRGESLLLADALGDASLKDQDSIISLNVRSALCAPLVYNRQIYGLIYLDRNVPGAYNEEDLEFLRTIALIVAPLIENARLWSEHKEHYDQAMVTLRETEARLIDMEREAAYMRLAQAMAHEIRNPLMGIGGMVRRMTQAESDCLDRGKLQAVLGLVERVESVMREVDDFVKLPSPERKLEKIDAVLQRCVDDHAEEWQRSDVRPVLASLTSRLLVSLDADLFSRAISMIFKEILPSVPKGSDFKLSIHDHGKEIEIMFGEAIEERCACDIYDQSLQRKPWSLGLFLNIAHKIISDHDGKMLFDPEGHAPYHMIIRLARTAKM